MDASAEIVEADAVELKEYFSKMEITEPDTLLLPPLKNLQYVNLTGSVGKDKRLSSNVKTFGSQVFSNLSAGPLKLTKINLNQPTRRPWVYFVNYNAGPVRGDFFLVKNW